MGDELETRRGEESLKRPPLILFKVGLVILCQVLRYRTLSLLHFK